VLTRTSARSEEEVIAGLVSVRGIGCWTAEMYLMFELRRLDVWPVDDLGVRQGCALAWQLQPALTRNNSNHSATASDPTARSSPATDGQPSPPPTWQQRARTPLTSPSTPTKQGGRMPTNLPDVILRYFERDTDRDIDSIVNLFADDATVIDEGEERHGTAEIRAWQTGAASKYTYTTEITSAEALDPDRYLVTGRLTGNFPGGTADLKWDFTIAGQHIARLTIAP
jgi:SnoaL-like domain